MSQFGAMTCFPQGLDTPHPAPQVSTCSARRVSNLFGHGCKETINTALEEMSKVGVYRISPSPTYTPPGDHRRAEGFTAVTPSSLKSRQITCVNSPISSESL